MSSQYGELRPTRGLDLLARLHTQQFSMGFYRLGGFTARGTVVYSGRQPNFAVLNRERHLYSAGRPSRWALAHISSLVCVLSFFHAHISSSLVLSVLPLDFHVNVICWSGVRGSMNRTVQL